MADTIEAPERIQNEVQLVDETTPEMRRAMARSDTWLDGNPEDVQEALDRRSTNRRKVIEWVRTNLVENTDYGVVKSKKSLWKPGAEKIAGMLGLQVQWPDLDSELDRLRNGADIIVFSCELLRNGEVQAQGAGARSLRQDGGDVNKAIKMAKKSAMIDAVLNVAGLSEVFTQDIEDMSEVETLNEQEQADLQAKAEELYGDKAEQCLEALAMRYYQLGHRDWTKIPAFRYDDAIRQLQERAK